MNLYFIYLCRLRNSLKNDIQVSIHFTGGNYTVQTGQLTALKMLFIIETVLLSEQYFTNPTY